MKDLSMPYLERILFCHEVKVGGRGGGKKRNVYLITNLYERKTETSITS